MNFQQIKFKGSKNSYSILIGNKILSLLPRKIKSLCPKTRKIAVVIDKKVPNHFKKSLEASKIP